MRAVSVWGFVALWLVPVLHALALRRVHAERSARRLAACGGALTFAIACGLVAAQYAGPQVDGIAAALAFGSGGRALHFSIDGLSGPMLPLFSLLTLAFIVGSPRSSLSHADLRSLLWLEALTLATLTTDDLPVLCAAWSLLVVPLDGLTGGRRAHPERAVARRVFRLYQGLGLACFAVACAILMAWSPGAAFLDGRVLQVDGSGVPERVRPLVFGALTLATLIRMGVAPFHSWLPVSIEQGSSSVPAALAAMRTGLYLLVRVGIPAFPAITQVAVPALAGIAFCSAIYGALAALGQHDLRRMIGFFIVSQSGIMLTGAAFRDPTAVGGALLYWLGFATATTGLVLMVSALEARTGSADMRSAGGIVRRAPLLSGCFFLFGLASIAIPGTVAFVAEDMLVRGALHRHPLLTLATLAAMTLNAITFVRAFGATFLGEPRARDAGVGTLEDLLPREHATAVVLLVVLIAAGLVPGPIIEAQARAAAAIAHGERSAPR